MVKYHFLRRKDVLMYLVEADHSTEELKEFLEETPELVELEDVRIVFLTAAEAAIRKDKADNLRVLLEYVQKHKIQGAVSAVEVAFAIRWEAFDCLYLLIDWLRYDVTANNFLTTGKEKHCQLLEYAYSKWNYNWLREDGTCGHRRFLLFLVQRGARVMGTADFVQLTHTIVSSDYIFRWNQRMIQDLMSTRVLMALVSAYTIKRAGQHSHVVKTKLPLDIIRKLVDFIRDK
jgi:hypothetical protein